MFWKAAEAGPQSSQILLQDLQVVTRGRKKLGKEGPVRRKEEREGREGTNTGQGRGMAVERVPTQYVSRLLTHLPAHCVEEEPTLYMLFLTQESRSNRAVLS